MPEHELQFSFPTFQKTALQVLPTVSLLFDLLWTALYYQPLTTLTKQFIGVVFPWALCPSLTRNGIIKLFFTVHPSVWNLCAASAALSNASLNLI